VSKRHLYVEGLQKSKDFSKQSCSSEHTTYRKVLISDVKLPNILGLIRAVLSLVRESPPHMPQNDDAYMLQQINAYVND